MSENPFIKRQKKGNKNKHGTLAEKKTAKRLGMKTKPSSGALDGAKGDLFNDDFLIEMKTTIKDSMVLKKEWLYKIYGEAFETNKYAILGITFVTNTGQSKKNDRWIMMPEHLFRQFVDRDKNET